MKNDDGDAGDTDDHAAADDDDADDHCHDGC